MRVLGIDYGSARVGVAIGDTDSCVASPWSVLQNKNEEQLISDIKALIQTESIEKVIVGVPHVLRDTSIETKQARSILRVVDQWKEAGIPVETVDESLTSRIAARQMIERGERGKRDDLAATAILQGWLERKSMSK